MFHSNDIPVWKENQYGSKESDKSTAGFSSSYVCTKNVESENVIFDQIEFIFKLFSGILSRLAYVHWFYDHVVDCESGLVWINLTLRSSKNPIISLKKFIYFNPCC